MAMNGTEIKIHLSEAENKHKFNFFSIAHQIEQRLQWNFFVRPTQCASASRASIEV